MKISISLPVYNEEKNIGHLLDSIIGQELKNVIIEDIVVVSSGSSDNTENIVNDFQNNDRRITLIKQNKREGKASAINLSLRNTINDIIVVSSGDVIFEKDTVENLCQQFTDANVGFTSANPIPVNPDDNFVGYLGYMHWRLHNKFSRHGEVMAFRKSLISELPNTTAVDEAWVESVISDKGYKMIHVNDAIVRNKSAGTIKDFIKQRRRHYAGHLDLKNRTNYEVSSLWLSVSSIKIMIKESLYSLPKFHYFLGYLFLEMYGRLLGSYDFHIKKENPYIWDIATTTKELKSNE